MQWNADTEFNVYFVRDVVIVLFQSISNRYQLISIEKSAGGYIQELNMVLCPHVPYTSCVIESSTHSFGPRVFLFICDSRYFATYIRIIWKNNLVTLEIKGKQIVYFSFPLEIE